MRVLKHLAKHPVAVLLVVSLLLVQALCDLALPTYTGQIVDLVILQGDDMQMRYLWATGAKMLAFTLLMVATSISIGFIASRTSAKIGLDLRRKVFTKVISFSKTEVNEFSTASLITRSTNDVTQVQTVSVMLLRMVLYAPIIGIGGVIMVARTDLSMSWTIGLAVAVVMGLVIVLFALVRPKFKMMQKLIDRVNLRMREILTNMSVIRAFGREDHEQKRFEDASADLMKTQLFTGRAMSLMGPSMMLVMNGVSVLIVWVATGQVDRGALQVGDMVAFITYATMIILSFLILSMVSIILPRANVAAERIDEVLNTEAVITEPEHPVDMREVEGELVSHGGKPGTVEFDNVSFRYAGAEADAISDISFTARPGTMTAIIGSTGCGKSTVLNLIPRFYDVTGGAVRIDGVDVRDMSTHDLRSLIGYVPQKSTLFSGTIESNLKFGGDEISEDDVERAARIAQAADFIAERDEGLEDHISQSGTNVSGGQKQRLAIARAIATRAPILLLDDSFSALDYATDRKLRTALAEEAGDSTVIVVAQRVSTVMGADQIIVLDEGEMVGIGTHAELMESCEEYREIAYSQLSASELGGGVA